MIMPECPECKGEGLYEWQISEYWEEPIRYEKRECELCGGYGIISHLRLAIYKAERGQSTNQQVNDDKE